MGEWHGKQLSPPDLKKNGDFISCKPALFLYILATELDDIFGFCLSDILEVISLEKIEFYFIFFTIYTLRQISPSSQGQTSYRPMFARI